MIVSPSFHCNFNCDFCCIKNKPGKLMDLDWLDKELTYHPELAREIDILGGEPSILPIEYQKNLIKICTKHANDKPYWTTNLYIIAPYIDRVYPIVSFDFDARQHMNTVLNNMIKMKVPYTVSTIMTKHLVEDIGAKKFLQYVELLKNATKWDLLLYIDQNSSPLYHPDQNKLFEFFDTVIKHPKVTFAPMLGWEGKADWRFENYWGAINLIPDNKYALFLDCNNPDIFTSFDTFDQCMSYYIKRCMEISKQKPCISCEFIGNCGCVAGYEPNKCHANQQLLRHIKEKYYVH